MTPAFGPLSTTRTTVNGVSFDMVRVPPGRFIDGEGTTRRELLVSHPFEIGTTLVTQTLWQAVAGSIPSNFRGEDLPVEQVSWRDVQVFLARLEGLGFSGFRLPSEAEWVWAARCGAPTRWAGADRAQLVAVTNAWQTSRVAGLSSSAAGTFDASGNVRAWQRDGWMVIPLGGIDAQGLASGPNRATRGGSWSFDPWNARVADRLQRDLGTRSINLGFRLLRASS